MYGKNICWVFPLLHAIIFQKFIYCLLAPLCLQTNQTNLEQKLNLLQATEPDSLQKCLDKRKTSQFIHRFIPWKVCIGNPSLQSYLGIHLEKKQILDQIMCILSNIPDCTRYFFLMQATHPWHLQQNNMMGSDNLEDNSVADNLRLSRNKTSMAIFQKWWPFF